MFYEFILLGKNDEGKNFDIVQFCIKMQSISFLCNNIVENNSQLVDPFIFALDYIVGVFIEIK
jgi:hypothetical protein